ncbi:unnamed protein product [Tenebrio molitor]|nr:unnamed protein product [Tenebrio molitor]
MPNHKQCLRTNENSCVLMNHTSTSEIDFKFTFCFIRNMFYSSCIDLI